MAQMKKQTKQNASSVQTWDLEFRSQTLWQRHSSLPMISVSMPGRHSCSPIVSLLGRQRGSLTINTWDVDILGSLLYCRGISIPSRSLLPMVAIQLIPSICSLGPLYASPWPGTYSRKKNDSSCPRVCCTEQEPTW